MGATAVVAFGLLPAGPGVSSTPAGFLTGERPFLVALADGVEIRPILTTGDVVGDYQMSGVPDGIGWFVSAGGAIEVYLNHELHPDFDPSSARVSHLTLSVDGRVAAAEYVVDGTEGYEWFCSSTLEVLDGVPWYTTGEESKHSPRMGTTIAVDASTGIVHETPWFGHFGHENVVPVQGLAAAFLGLPEDGFREFSQLFVYIARSFEGAFAGDEGSLRVWVPDDAVSDGNPSADDLAKGETMAGHLARIPRAEHLRPLRLEKLVQSMGAYDFNRIEDLTADPNHPGAIYFAETGRANQEVTHGRVYRLDVDPEHPRRATLSVVLDAAAGDDLFNPDNLGISETALVIQEDRNWYRSGYNRVLVYDLASGTLTPVARVDTDPAIVEARGPGAWESSGVVSVADAFGPGWWLLTVQGHYSDMPVPDESLEPGSATGEGGQLVLVFIPGT
jgi:hypothetical protein